MFDTWTLAVLGEMTRAAAISLFDCPAATRRRTSSSRPVRPGSPRVAVRRRPGGSSSAICAASGRGAEPLRDRRGAAQPRRRLAAGPLPPARSARRGSARRPPGRAGRRPPTRRRPRPRRRAGRRRRRRPARRRSKTRLGSSAANDSCQARCTGPQHVQLLREHAAACRAARRRPRPAPGRPPRPRSRAAARRTGGCSPTGRTGASASAARRRRRRAPRRPAPARCRVGERQVILLVVAAAGEHARRRAGAPGRGGDVAPGERDRAVKHPQPDPGARRRREVERALGDLQPPRPSARGTSSGSARLIARNAPPVRARPCRSASAMPCRAARAARSNSPAPHSRCVSMITSLIDGVVRPGLLRDLARPARAAGRPRCRWLRDLAPPGLDHRQVGERLRLRVEVAVLAREPQRLRRPGAVLRPVVVACRSARRRAAAPSAPTARRPRAPGRAPGAGRPPSAPGRGPCGT